MRTFDLIVIGSGVAMGVAEEALEHGLKVAVVDRGPIGGTCPNLGCIPTKMLALPADRIMEIREARRLGIDAGITAIDFRGIMERMRRDVTQRQQHMREGIEQAEGLKYFDGTGRFVADYTVEVNGERLTAPKIVIAAGSRPAIPPIKGLEEAGYLTNESALQLNDCPASLVILGGGYVGVEFAHFFAAMGSRVTLIEMGDRLVSSEEPEVAELLARELSQRMEVILGGRVESVRKDGHRTAVVIGGETRREILAEQILVATGRRSNADLLQLEKTGVAVNEKGFVKVNEYMETSRQNIFAIGDINGKHMFTHTGNRMAAVAANNLFHDDKVKMDYYAAPHAVFTWPEIASVGITEAQARRDDIEIDIGVARYADTAYGEAMVEEKGFAKAVMEKETRRILGFHVIGPYAAIVIQEVINAMASGGQAREIEVGIHIHPALPELVQRTINSLVE